MVQRLTSEEYWSLTPPGRELHDYWRQWKKPLYKEMADSGKLYPYLKKEGTRLNDLIIELMQDGMAEDGAWEVARSQMYDEMMD